MSSLESTIDSCQCGGCNEEVNTDYLIQNCIIPYTTACLLVMQSGRILQMGLMHPKIRKTIFLVTIYI